VERSNVFICILISWVEKDAILKLISCRFQGLWVLNNFTLSNKAWLATYFELPHPQLRNPKSLRTRNCSQLAFLMVATRKRNRNFIKFL
jgi:hypothetical protein